MSKRGYALIADSNIVIAPMLQAKLAVMGVRESRVREKVRHLIQTVIDRAENEAWEPLFVDSRKERKLLSYLSKRKQQAPGGWLANFLIKPRRSPQDLNGIVFTRRCYSETRPTPEQERAAEGNGTPRTNVQLSFRATQASKREPIRIDVFRFVEADETLGMDGD